MDGQSLCNYEGIEDYRLDEEASGLLAMAILQTKVSGGHYGEKDVDAECREGPNLVWS